MSGSRQRPSFQDTSPYVVLIGDVGTGKSTIVEKLTGEVGRSSDASESFTRTCGYFSTPDKRLKISDTPGANSMKDKFKHNIQIATAFNYEPVSKVFIVVKAAARIDEVVSRVREYADRFLELPLDLVAVLVTHTDLVTTWTWNDFVDLIEEELGFSEVIFSSLDTNAIALLADILKLCGKKHQISVDTENFLKLFKVHNSNRKILLATSEEVNRVRNIKIDFDEARQAFQGKDAVDLFFEFQAWMEDEIVECKKRVAEKNNFTFLGNSAANEAGHIANMVNQLRMVLYDVRTESLAYQNDHGVSELRKCPHCGLIWAKIEGCDGDTQCGSRLSNGFDVRDPNYGVLATFTFRTVGGKLNICKSGTRTLHDQNRDRSGHGHGCGRMINWGKMQPVQVPGEFCETPEVTTEDVSVLPQGAQGFKKKLGGALKDAYDYATGNK